jgi:hypothetical protein
LFFGDLSEGSGEFEGGEDFGAVAVEEFEVVGEVVGFVDVAADEEDGALEFVFEGGGDGGDAGAP